MTDWNQIIRVGWPGIRCKIDHKDDPHLAERVTTDSALTEKLVAVGDLRIEWGEENPPAVEEIVARKDEIEAIIFADEQARVRLKAFEAKWPYPRILEAMGDADLLEELRADAKAAG